MSTTHPIIRPAVGTIVDVYFPCLRDEDCDDLPAQLAEVTAVDHDSITVRVILEWDIDDETATVSTANTGAEVTVYDQEQAAGEAVVVDPVAEAA